MPGLTPIERKSKTTNLESRYSSQKSGGAFDVKGSVGEPGKSPKSSIFIDSLQNGKYLTPDGFVVKELMGITHFKDVQGNKSAELSMYIKGINTSKYKP